MRSQININLLTSATAKRNSSSKCKHAPTLIFNRMFCYGLISAPTLQSFKKGILKVKHVSSNVHIFLLTPSHLPPHHRAPWTEWPSKPWKRWRRESSRPKERASARAAVEPLIHWAAAPPQTAPSVWRSTSTGRWEKTLDLNLGLYLLCFIDWGLSYQNCMIQTMVLVANNCGLLHGLLCQLLQKVDISCFDVHMYQYEHYFEINL